MEFRTARSNPPRSGRPVACESRRVGRYVRPNGGQQPHGFGTGAQIVAPFGGDTDLYVGRDLDDLERVGMGQNRSLDQKVEEAFHQGECRC